MMFKEKEEEKKKKKRKKGMFIFFEHRAKILFKVNQTLLTMLTLFFVNKELKNDYSFYSFFFYCTSFDIHVI